MVTKPFAVYGRSSRNIHVITLLVTLTSCAGYVPGRQAYWDEQVREMCARDGGVQIFERIKVSSAEAALLGKVGGRISIPLRETAPLGSPAYFEATSAVLHGGNPGVWRTEWLVRRGSDGALLARGVTYDRSGGDIPSWAHPSRFTCPPEIGLLLQQVYLIEGVDK